MYLLFLYRQFYNILLLNGGEKMLLEWVNSCLETLQKDAKRMDSRKFMNNLIGQPAVKLINASDVTGLDKMRIALLNKYFNTTLVDDLLKYLSEQHDLIVKQSEKIARKEKETDQAYQARQTSAYDKARSTLAKSMSNRLKELRGVETGLVAIDGAYGIDERGDFTLEEMIALKDEMQKVESIPLSTANALWRTAKVAAGAAAAGAVGYGAYQWATGQWDPVKFVTETLPTTASLLKNRALEYMFVPALRNLSVPSGIDRSIVPPLSLSAAQDVSIAGHNALVQASKDNTARVIAETAKGAAAAVARRADLAARGLLPKLDIKEGILDRMSNWWYSR